MSGLGGISEQALGQNCGITHRIHVWYIYLHIVDFNGKCEQIYHTWILWVSENNLYLPQYFVNIWPDSWLEHLNFDNGKLFFSCCFCNISGFDTDTHWHTYITNMLQNWEFKGSTLVFFSNWWSKRSVHQTAKLKCWFFEGLDDQNANTSTNCLLDGWQVSTDRGGQVVWLKAMHQNHGSCEPTSVIDSGSVSAGAP